MFIELTTLDNSLTTLNINSIAAVDEDSGLNGEVTVMLPNGKGFLVKESYEEVKRLINSELKAYFRIMGKN